MAIVFGDAVVGFVASLVVSTIVIYVVAKFLGETEGIGTAILTALIGSLIYAGSYYFLGTGLLAAVIGGVGWLIALGSMYNMGWGKAFVAAVVIWIFAMLISGMLPTLVGPL